MCLCIINCHLYLSSYHLLSPFVQILIFHLLWWREDVAWLAQSEEGGCGVACWGSGDKLGTTWSRELTHSERLWQMILSWTYWTNFAITEGAPVYTGASDLRSQWSGCEYLLCIQLLFSKTCLHKVNTVQTSF